ncbi:plasmid partitioning/stability family protein [Escherichia coli]|nr:plasmid partitioning/stability family protein [Escherichia coli]
MPAGKYSFYLHPDDRADVAATATLESISQPMRGEFFRTSVIAGCALYRIDCRLPGLLTEIFDGQLRCGQFLSLLGAISGQYQVTADLEVEALGSVQRVIQDTQTERRRFTLQLLDDQASSDTAALLESLPSRVRGQQLRNLLIAGFALHTLDARFPRLLASLPAPPSCISELEELARQVRGIQKVAPSERIQMSQKEAITQPTLDITAGQSSEIVQKMKKLF